MVSMRRFFFLFCCIFLFPYFSKSADIFRILDTEHDALQCRLDLIEQSQKEILLSYYIVIDDVIGMAIFDLLVEASEKRGVKVKILVDALNTKISKPVLAYLEEKGIEIKVFNPGSILRPLNYARRLHDKLFLTDMKSLIIGGRNIKREYYSLGVDKNFLDRDVFVQGDKAVTSARSHFYGIWDNPLISKKKKTIKLTDEDRKLIVHRFAEASILLQHSKGIYIRTRNNWAKGQPSTANPVNFEHDNFFVKNKFGKIVYGDVKVSGSTKGLIKLIEKAKQTILIENAYVIPTRKWYKALSDALKRGVKIRVLTNSMQTNDVAIAQAAYMNARHKLVKMGIEVWEYQGPKTLHIKSAVIDDSISIVSSYNLDALAERWSTEVAAWVIDPQLAREHKAIMDSHLKNAVQIGVDNVPKFGNGNNFKPYPWCKRLKLWCYRHTVAWTLKLF